MNNILNTLLLSRKQIHLPHRARNNRGSSSSGRKDWQFRDQMLERLENRLFLSGVTLITHGFSLFETRPSWLDDFANAIANEAGGLSSAATWYEMTLDDSLFSSGIRVTDFDKKGRSTGDPEYLDLDKTTMGELILTVNWAAGSNHLISSPITAETVARAILPELLKTNAAPGLSAPLAELPFHLIGHSRGGSLVTKLAELLGEQGLWVDQVTTLDPHPLAWPDLGVYHPILRPTDPQPPDPPLKLTSNVIFADNYWRKDPWWDPLTSFDFDGHEVSGACNLQLQEDILSGAGFLSEHSDVHLWYHGTIGHIEDGLPLFPSGYTDGTKVGSDWYVSPHPTRSSTGFYYSRIHGGVRPPGGLASAFGGFTSDGRASVSTTSTQWPNIAALSTGGSYTFAKGQAINVNFKYSDGANLAEVLLYLDTDSNPYNGEANEAHDGAFYTTSPRSTPRDGTVNVSTTKDVAGSYYLRAVIKNESNYQRIVYLPHKITIVYTPADTTPPQATLSFPANRGSIAQSAINAAQYIEVTFSDSSGLNLATITDSGQEFSISGLTINGTPSLVSGTTYRYFFTGTLPLGNITVAFSSGAWADNATPANVNQAFNQSFSVSSKPIITLVTPSTLPPLPADQTQLITLSGSGFSPSSTLNFISALGNSYTGRVPTYNASTGQLSYYISVGTAQGYWSVQVVNNGVVSEPFYFLVSSLTPVVKPTISPNGGAYSDTVQVNLSTSTSGATIRYTLDGSDPTAASDLYTSQLTLSTSVTLKARAFKTGMADSAVASATFAVEASPAGPVIADVSPALLQPSAFTQFISIFGSGFDHDSVPYFYDPSGNLVQNNTTDYVNSGQIDYHVPVAAKSGTWNVKVINSSTGLQSNLFPFEVATLSPGNYPIQTSPASGAIGVTGQPTLRWEPLAGMTSTDYYRVMVAKTEDLPRDPNVTGLDGSISQWISTTKLTEVTPSTSFLPGKTYYWQIQASVDDVRQVWSPIWAFTMAGELNLKPVVESAGITPSTVTKGGAVTFTAGGVSDPNSSPDYVKYVQWYFESNGIPGLQTFAETNSDSAIADNNGVDGWSITASTFGTSTNYSPGSHTIYTVARDLFGLYSTPIVGTLTVLPADVPAPTIQKFTFDQGVSPPVLKLTFNTLISHRMATNIFQITGPSNPQVDSYSFDAATNTLALKLTPGDLANGDYKFDIPYFSNQIYNANGVTLQGTKSFNFSVLTGDANGDRVVDSQDLTLVMQNQNIGSGHGWADGDFNGDGLVDTLDLQILQNNLGQFLPALAGAPAQPANSSPANNAPLTALTPTLQAGAFYDSQGDTHVASQWVVTRISDSLVVFNSGEDPTNKISIPLGTLEESTTYSWKVRYKDSRGTWSNYSSPTTFTTLKIRGPVFYGTSGDDTFHLRLNGPNVEFFENVPTSGLPTFTLPLALAETIGMDGGGGLDQLYVDSGTYSFAMDLGEVNPHLKLHVGASTVQLNASQHLAGLTLGSGSIVRLGGGGDKLLVTGMLSITSPGKLELNDNALLVHDGVLSVILDQYKTGRITSGTASNLSGLTGLAINSGATFHTLRGVGTAFAGQTVVSSDILLNYTYLGDANIDGLVNFQDYLALDCGYLFGGAGWSQGDFNYDGKIDGLDYTIIQDSFTWQRTPELTVTSGETFTSASGLRLSSLTISDGGRVQLSAGHAQLLDVRSLSIGSSGLLDLTDNALSVHTSTLSTVTSWVTAGRILSTTAAATGGLKGLGVIMGSTYQQLHGPTALFQGKQPDASDVLVKYTYRGDANLNGMIDFNDYLAIDAGFLFGGSGWAGGDFDYSGQVTAADYALIDRSYLAQSPAGAAPLIAQHTIWFGEAYLAALAPDPIDVAPIDPVVPDPPLPPVTPPAKTSPVLPFPAGWQHTPQAVPPAPTVRYVPAARRGADPWARLMDLTAAEFKSKAMDGALGGPLWQVPLPRSADKAGEDADTLLQVHDLAQQIFPSALRVGRPRPA